MLTINTMLWDLDGTLTDPGLGITNSVMYALKKFGITVEDRQSLYPFIGPPLKTSFMQFYGFSDSQAEDAIGYYREYYADKGILENKLYPGIADVLAELQRRGYRHALATSKPQPFAERIIAHFGLGGYFSFLQGSDLAGHHVDKTGIIADALRGVGCTGRQAVMVGDRCFDMQGARAHGLIGLGVLYGYGSRQELLDTGADVLAETPTDIPACLAGCSRLAD